MRYLMGKTNKFKRIWANMVVHEDAKLRYSSHLKIASVYVGWQPVIRCYQQVIRIHFGGSLDTTHVGQRPPQIGRPNALQMKSNGRKWTRKMFARSISKHRTILNTNFRLWYSRMQDAYKYALMTWNTSNLVS